MEDRQYFTTQTLSNGIAVFSHQHQVPFTQIRILIPVGSAHAHNKNPNGCYGITHLLEHVVINQRETGESSDSALSELVSEAGGNFNAWTYNFYSEFLLELPEPIDQSIIDTFIQAIYNPSFDEAELQTQKNIIKNEKELTKYFPGDTQLSQYQFNQWMQVIQVSKDQIFGTKDTLESITIEQLEKFHEFCHSDQCKVIVGGQTKNLELTTKLSEIKTHATKLAEKYTPAGWTDQRHQAQFFSEINSPHLYWGGIGEVTAENLIGLRVLLSFLTDENSGILNQWLRQDRGWSYGCSGTDWFDRDYQACMISIPLSSREQAEEVKKEVNEKVVSALKDKARLKKHIEQMRREECFSFETLNERMEEAAHELIDIGSIITEKQYQELLTEFQSPDKIQHIYETFLHPDQGGMLTALPK